jgi:hypothetical protein
MQCVLVVMSCCVCDWASLLRSGFLSRHVMPWVGTTGLGGVLLLLLLLLLAGGSGMSGWTVGPTGLLLPRVHDVLSVALRNLYI